jgi:hypothetical protein
MAAARHALEAGVQVAGVPAQGGSMLIVLRAIALTTAVICLPVFDAVAQTTEPILGTWELNLAKSTFNPGPAPRSDTRTFVMTGKDIKAITKGVDSTGQAYTEEWIVIYDGKDHPIDNPNADTVARRRIDPYTVELTQKKAGKIVITGSRIISKDGKTMTITEKGVDAQGRKVDTVEVFERRP